MSETLSGVYRGIVEDVDDPEERKRYRVRVAKVHRDGIASSHLPWAELCGFAGKGFGDIPHYRVGDGVVVMFEGGDRRFPWIMGGWLSYEGGTSDMPSEQTGDYARTQRRWVRYDRNGQKILMDEEAQILELTSGKSQVLIRGGDGSITVKTDGVLDVTAPRVNVNEATEVNVEVTDRLFAEIANETSLTCGDVVSIRGANEINIGEYQPAGQVVPTPETTAVVNIKGATTVNVESGQDTNVNVGTTFTLNAGGDVLMDGEANFTVDGKARVHVLSDGACDVEAEQINLTSTGSVITMDAASDLTLNVGNDCDMTVNGQLSATVQGSLTADIQGPADIDVAGAVTLDAGGNVTVHSQGVGTFEADSVVEIKAPVINVEASNALNLESSGVSRLIGSSLLINT